MALLVTLVGVLIVGIGVLIAVAPMRFIHWIASMETTMRFRVAILVRVAIGLLFLLAAQSCRQPAVVRIVGIIILLAAAGLLLLGRERVDSFLNWWLTRPLSLFRVWAVVSLGFGALLIYSGA